MAFVHTYDQYIKYPRPRLPMPNIDMLGDPVTLGTDELGIKFSSLFKKVGKPLLIGSAAVAGGALLGPALPSIGSTAIGKAIMAVAPVAKQVATAATQVAPVAAKIYAAQQQEKMAEAGIYQPMVAPDASMFAPSPGIPPQPEVETRPEVEKEDIISTLTSPKYLPFVIGGGAILLIMLLKRR